MEIGKLRHSIDIQRETSTPDGMGGATKTWATLSSVFASVESLSGREFFAAQQTQSLVTHKVTTRFYPGITTADRIRFGSRLFDITAVLNTEERNIWLTIMATERKP